MSTMRQAIGLMSGTSLDGIDVAIITTDGRQRAESGPALTVPYAPALRERLRAVLGGIGPVAEVERALTEAHAEAVARFASEHGISAAVIGFHGHTVLHRPAERRTWQIGDGALLARLTGIDVVCDFRSADVAAGGEGAPFVPLYHAALAAGLDKPLAILNVGGVANVTWLGAEEGAILAFDTGPGNAPIDDWALRHLGRPVDLDGALARAGRVDSARLAALPRQSLFRSPAAEIARSRRFRRFRRWWAGRGGRCGDLDRHDGGGNRPRRRSFPDPSLPLAGHRRRPPQSGADGRVGAPACRPRRAGRGRGLDGDALEAQAFAYLAVRSLEGLPLSLPSTTGVARPMTGGRLFRAGA